VRKIIEEKKREKSPGRDHGISANKMKSTEEGLARRAGICAEQGRMGGCNQAILGLKERSLIWHFKSHASCFAIRPKPSSKDKKRFFIPCLFIDQGKRLSRPILIG
jgi:hypothetical protein